MNNSVTNNSKLQSKDTIVKRKADSSSGIKRQRQRPRLDMNQAPRIPVRSTLASRSNHNSPTSTAERLSNISASSIASSSRLSNASINSNSSKTSVASSSSTKSMSASTRTRKPPLEKTKKSIPTWDTKGRLNQLQAQLTETSEEVNEIEKLQQDLESSLQSKDTMLREAMQKVADLEHTIQETEERHRDELNKIREKFVSKNRELIYSNDRRKKQFAGFESELSTTDFEHRQTERAIEDEERENTTLKTQKRHVEESLSELDAATRSKRLKKKSLISALAAAEEKSATLSNHIESKSRYIQELQRSLLENEKLRRKDHDKLQELKGNIRVFCRVRPAVNSKTEPNLINARFFGDDNESMELTEQTSSTLGKSITKSHTFTFDRVFSPEASQKDCFEEISQLVQSALDGFNVCIFAYGQTGSGKTFTMQGPSSPTEETSGMIPRAVQQIYEVVQQLKQFGWEYKMEGQFLEIYNETINDLLGNSSNYGKIKHEIHHEKNGKTSVTEMTSVVLDSPSKVKLMLRKANQNRATGATNMNERSSRSHSVFTLQLTGHNAATGENTAGILNLIDLAGSERLSMSGSTGDRLRETQAINKSLSCLGDVIHALINNKEGGHIPYRNSKLTYLLRNSLGGNCKTLMFVNVSPLMEHFGESLCSLRFATKVSLWEGLGGDLCQ
ncbi:kinesin family member C1 [Mucor circinelloides 1006PhL]|uniref:Kinesin family member C1 n=1 Tax=Mucor circinelloides f. circinelloides (strain 1006PhL) TaxID=1220926 RepID=S2JCA0_MUCC1|nr:kinesin family member C1 [Mucor circinelloides 1006PhL]